MASASSSGDTRSTDLSITILDHVKKYMHEGGVTLHIDESRERFVTDTAITLTLLVNGELPGLNGHRRLLLGRKVFGKTALLCAIQSAVISVFGDKVVVCNVSNDYRPTYVYPSQVILHATGHLVSDGSRPCEYVDELKNAGKFVFLVVDEIQYVFGKAYAFTSLIGNLNK